MSRAFYFFKLGAVWGPLQWDQVCSRDPHGVTTVLAFSPCRYPTVERSMRVPPASPPCNGPLCPLSLSLWVRAPCTPATLPRYLPELPPADLCISEGLQTHIAGNSRKILAICLLDSWRSWLFAWPSLPVCVGDIFECAGLNSSFP